MNRLRTNTAMSHVFSNFAHTRMAPQFAGLVSGLCATVPTCVLTSGVLKGSTGDLVSRDNCDEMSPAAKARQEYLHSWQLEMESFDRF